MSRLTETSVDEHVALCRLNRPDARNALSPELMEELATEVERFDADPQIRVVVIAGSDEVFAAGADINALRERTFEESLRHPAAAFWRRLAACRTPLIAAVSGFALGGGCELALLCDLIVASESAEFGQPEITLGIIPGGGGVTVLVVSVSGVCNPCPSAPLLFRLPFLSCFAPAGALLRAATYFDTGNPADLRALM